MDKKKKKLAKKIDAKLIIIGILIILFFSNTNFYKNVIKIITKNYETRIIETYGFCGGESIGFLKFLKNKYKFTDNPKIINYVHTPQVNWAIINTNNINKIAKEKILLNYPGESININLEKINNSLFEFTDLFFFSNNFEELKKIIIINNPNNTLNLTIYTKDKLNLKKIIKTINYDPKLINMLNIRFDEIDLNETKLYFEISNDKFISENNKQIKVTLENKFKFKKSEIIEKYENCYYIK